MKKNNKLRLISWLILSFVGFISFLIITDHFFYGKNHRPPRSWEEIYDNLWMYIIYSLVFAIGISIWAYLNSPEDKNKKR
jgi:hypothetical protein